MPNYSSHDREAWREPTPLATTMLPAAWLHFVLARYECDSRDEVTAFLHRYPALVALLAEAPEHVEAAFGPGVPMTLRVYYHPDEEDAEELFALVHFPGSVGDAELRLARFDADCWLGQTAAARDRLGFDVMFV